MKPKINQYIPTALDSLNSLETRRAYARWMSHFNEWYNEAARDQPITHNLIVNYIASLEEEHKPPTRIIALSAVKKLCETIHNNDREAIDLYTYTIIKGIKPTKYKRKLTGKMIPSEAIEKLLEVCKCDKKPAGLRDAAIIAMLHATGMRRGECAALIIEDYDSDESMVLLRETKNKEDRVTYLTPGAESHLKAWLSLRNQSPGPLFWRTKRGGDLWPGKGLSGSAIYNILKFRSTQAGLEDYTPHDFRRTLISNLLAQQVDMALVSRIAGHSSVAMTARYDRRKDEAMRAAIQKIYTPFA